jgi:hypothetical protein
MTAFDLVVAHRQDKSTATADVFEALVSVSGLTAGPDLIVERFELSFAPATHTDLFAAALAAEKQLAGSGFRVLDDLTSYGSFGKAVLSR